MFPETYYVTSLKDFALVIPVPRGYHESFLGDFCHGYRHTEPIWAAVPKQKSEQISLLVAQKCPSTKLNAGQPQGIGRKLYDNKRISNSYRFYLETEDIGNC